MAAWTVICKACANDRGVKAKGGVRLCVARGVPRLLRGKRIVAGWTVGDACLWFEPKTRKER